MRLYLLDTHVWIWAMQGGPEALSKGAEAAIQRAASEGTLALSAITPWEVAMLEARGRIRLQMECLAWISESIQRSGAQLLPLSPAVAVESTRLPGELHGDPADRIIAATARQHGAVLLTRDRLLLTYAAQGHLEAIES